MFKSLLAVAIAAGCLALPISNASAASQVMPDAIARAPLVIPVQPVYGYGYGYGYGHGYGCGWRCQEWRHRRHERWEAHRHWEHRRWEAGRWRRPYWGYGY